MYDNGNGKINQGDTNCGLYLAKLVLYTLIQKFGTISQTNLDA